MLSGAVAAGKSLLGCEKGLMLNMKYPGNRGLICRKENASLRGSTIQTLLQQVLDPEIIVSYNQSKGELIHRTPDPKQNSTIVFSGLDKKADQAYPTKIGSTEYGWIFVDEGTELTEGDWLMLSTRIRYRIPKYTADQNSIIPRQLFTATNPDGPHHFLYKFFFEKLGPDRHVFLTTPYDNPHLPEGYLKGLEDTLTGTARERLLFGKWVQSEGAIYANFDMRKHVHGDDAFLPYGDYKDLIIGADSNYPLPRAAVLVGIRGDGTVDILEEYYKPHSHVEQVGEWGEALYLKVEKYITGYHDPSDPSAIEKLNHFKGLTFGKADNTVLGGISEVSRYIDNNLIRVHKSCVNLIRELMNYKWQTGKEGDKPVKENDHSCDALRYALYSHRMNAGTYKIFYDKEGTVL